MSFTIFVILPSEDVCTLRGLRSGTSIRAVRKRLELETGLPAQTYRLTCAEGQVLHEEHVLHLDVNVWEGFVVRMRLLDSWQDLHDQIVAGDVQRVVQHGAVHLRKEAVPFDSEEASKVRDIVAERGTVALFIASFLGMQEMCKALLSVGVNPNGKTLYGRTSLFAAISCDNDHVMEILLAHGADLEVQDVDGVSGAELARRVPAKLCLRKIRQRRQQSKGNDTRLVHEEKGLRPPSAYVFRANHVTKSTSDSVEADSDSASLMSSRQRPQRVQLFQESHLLRPASSAPARPTSRATSRREKGTSGNSNNSADSPCTPRRLRANMSSKLSQHSEVFVWNDNVNRVSSPPVSQVKVEAQRSSGSTKVKKGNVDAERTYHLSTPVTPRVLLPHRPAVQDFSFSGARSVLTTSSATFRPVGAHAFEHNLSQGRRAMAQTKVPETLLKYFKRSGLEIQTASNVDDNNREKDYAPLQEPPARPSSREESPEDVQLGGTTDYGSVVGSQEVLSVASAPELQATGTSDAAVGSLHGDSDDDGGRVMSRGGTVRFSGRQRSRLLVSRQKQVESWKTMKRRIKIAEEQKRKDLDQNSLKRQSSKESFESWLERKRKERLHLSKDANSSDDSDRDDDETDKDGEHSQVFNLWLKEIKQRPLGRPQTAAPDSLRRRQTRPLRNLVQLGGSVGEDDSRPDPSTYMSAYKDWQEKRDSSNTKDKLSVADIKDAKRRLEEKRQQLLAMALTYEEWLQHTEERKQLMHAILRADLQQLADIEQRNFRTHRAPRQISFTQWRDKVDRREAEMRSHTQRMRRPQPESPTVRSSAAVPHEEWVKRKKEEARRESVAARVKSEEEEEKGLATSSRRSEKEAAWEAWLQQKHRQELLQLSQPLHPQRQLGMVMRPKKTPTITQC